MLISLNMRKMKKGERYLYPSLSFSKVDGVATRKQIEIIKESKDFTAGLMDGGDDSSSIPSKILDGLNDEEGSSAVEATSRLVKKHEGRAGEDLQCNAHSFLFSTTDASHLPVPNLPIRTLLEPHLHDRPLHHLSDL